MVSAPVMAHKGCEKADTGNICILFHCKTTWKSEHRDIKSQFRISSSDSRTLSWFLFSTLSASAVCFQEAPYMPYCTCRKFQLSLGLIKLIHFPRTHELKILKNMHPNNIKKTLIKTKLKSDKQTSLRLTGQKLLLI